MKYINIAFIFLSTIFLINCNFSGESNKVPIKQDKIEKNPLIGAWMVISTKNITTGEMQKEPDHYYHIFSQSHHMIFVAGKGREKIKKNFWKMSPEEIKTQLPTGGGFMKYEIKGNKFYSTYISAMSAYYEDVKIVDEFEFVGDTLIHRNDHYLDGNMREWKLIKLE